MKLLTNVSFAVLAAAFVALPIAILATLVAPAAVHWTYFVAVRLILVSALDSCFFVACVVPDRRQKQRC